MDYDKIERAKKGFEQYKKHLPEGFEITPRRSLGKVVKRKRAKKKEVIIV